MASHWLGICPARLSNSLPVHAPLCTSHRSPDHGDGDKVVIDVEEYELLFLKYKKERVY